MSKFASKIVAQARSWIGRNEADGSHKHIIDVYNSHKPHPRGYKVKYTDAWCATFVSAVAIEVGYTDIIPVECGCESMIALCKKLGIWVEDESRIPAPGDIIFYDWQDGGTGNNTGGADHVGYVEKVSGCTITVIEGNYSNAVKRRTLAVNGRYIRGYAVPKYDQEDATAETDTVKADYAVEMRYLKKGMTGEDVRALQILLIGRGYDCGSYGADGDFGSATRKAVRAYQKANGLTVDGVAGLKTWTRLLRG